MILLSQSTEDYLKSVYNLENGDAVVTNDIANSLDVSPSSVTKMVKRLSDNGYLTYHSHRGVKLTEKGRKAALKVIRRHRLIELYLFNELDYSWDEVHEEACNLEHYISDKLEDAIDKKLGYPTTDPHGDPIPGKNGELPITSTLKISDAKEGETYKVSRIDGEDSALLVYLEENSVLPGKFIKLIKKHPFGGSVEIMIDGETKQLGSIAADSIFVSND